MEDVRFDELTGRQVLIAEDRASRPNDFAPTGADAGGVDDAPRADCPFCPGNESQTPATRYEALGPDGEWRARAVANKYPAVSEERAQGVHEVLIESRRHVQRTGQLSEDELTAAIGVYADRLASAAANPDYPYRLLFKNVGASAGASLAHLHSQLIALPEVPPHIAEEQRRLAAYRTRTGRCGWCDRVADEREAGKRVVADSGDWLAFCPPASRQPYETWILPTEHESVFETQAAAGTLTRPLLAGHLLAVTRAIEAEIGPAGYNLMIHTAAAGVEQWHWRIEIVPRVASLAGLELATGLFMNVVSPERAAERLRRRIAAPLA